MSLMEVVHICELNTLNKPATVLNENAKTECHHPKFSDITFIVGKEKKAFPAIRGIFAMQCAYWATKLYSGQTITFGQKIIEDDINITETGFKFIHEFLYRLEPVITPENVIDVLYAANKYNLTNLVVHCNLFIDGVYNSTQYTINIPHILLFETRAIQLNLSVNHKVRQQFQNWLTIETSEQIIQSKAFLLAPKELIIEIIQNDSFSVKEEDIWIRCKEWCTYQIQTRNSDEDIKTDVTWDVLMRKYFVKHVRFSLMPKQFFVKHVYSSNVLSMDESINITLHFMDSTMNVNYNINHRHKVIYECKTELERLQIENQKLKSQFDIYKNAQVLQFSLEMSSKYEGIDNTYEGLTNNNINVGVATNESKTNEYIMANFGKRQHVIRMDIGINSKQKWNVEYLNNCKVQYKDDAGQWTDWKVMTNLQQNVISVIDVDIKTTAMRIFYSGRFYVGCWRFYGTDIVLIKPPVTKRNNKLTQNLQFDQQNNEVETKLNEFDERFNENEYFVLSNGNRTATFAKIGLPGAHDYQYYPACRLSHPINASDEKSQAVTFKLFQYGWFGIGSDTVTPHGFPGYTNSGFMIRISNGGSWYNDIGNAIGHHAMGNLTNQIVTMKYTPDSKELTVITENGQEYIYTHKDMPSSKHAYFVFTMAGGKVDILDTDKAIEVRQENKGNELAK